MSKLPSKVTREDLDHILAQSKIEFNVLGGKLTHCMITLPSGFIVTGESSCVDPAEYNKELGEKYAQENAVQTLWMLEGYSLAGALYEQREHQSVCGYGVRAWRNSKEYRQTKTVCKTA